MRGLLLFILLVANTAHSQMIKYDVIARCGKDNYLAYFEQAAILSKDIKLLFHNHYADFVCGGKFRKPVFGGDPLILKTNVKEEDSLELKQLKGLKKTEFKVGQRVRVPCFEIDDVSRFEADVLSIRADYISFTYDDEEAEYACGLGRYFHITHESPFVQK